MENTDFNGLSIERVTEADFDCIKKFLLTDFLYNEPMNRSINLTAEDSNELFDDLINAGIASSLSYILRTPDGKIAALRLASILNRPEGVCPSEHNDMSTWKKNAANDNNNKKATKTKKLSPKARIIADILQELESKIWVLTNPGLKHLLLWSIISVHKDYTRRGLAEKMLCYNLDEARQMGCQGCVSEASAFKSQLLFKKLGYEIIHEIKHSEWLDDKGQQIFKCDDNTNSTQLVFKLL